MDKKKDTDTVNEVIIILTMSYKIVNYCVNISSINEITAENNTTCRLIFLVEMITSLNNFSRNYHTNNKTFSARIVTRQNFLVEIVPHC
jgi:hypothetical protein